MLEKDDFIMDVEQATVEKYMRQFDAARLIHGHTHRPADHTFTDRDGQNRVRHVLGDWYGDCSVLLAGPTGIRRITASQYVQPARNGE
jgi:UDP-2,3-diacylglucosamine hydrolase